MTHVIIVGAGGQGLVVADIIEHMRAHADIGIVGLVDDDRRLTGTPVLAFRVIGTRDSLRTTPHDAIVVAVGDNLRRESLSDELAAAGERILTVIHPFSSIGRDVELGAGAMISAGAVIVAGVRAGAGLLLNTRSSIDHQSRLGRCVHVGPGATVGANVAIGDRVLVGAGATVMSGVSIGADATVGAGALVTRDVPAGVVVAGVPARVRGPR
jgi:sugar O-acyltransferase (sialic acid O-acetyltransferase NeuD family)